MNLRKKDREKIEELLKVDGDYIKGYSLAFNPFEFTKKNISIFANKRFNSCLYNGVLYGLNLDILEGITVDTLYNYEDKIDECMREGIDPSTVEIEEVESARYYFVKIFVKSMIEALEKAKEIRKKEIEDEKRKEKEAKGK